MDLRVRPDAYEPVFLDAARQREFDVEGYTVVPFLAAGEVQALLDGYAALVPDADQEIIAFDYTREDRAPMEGARRLLTPVFERHVPELFVDHEAIFWTFVIKPPGPHGELGLHDDRTYVDERRSQACTVWIPLVDTSPELDNGCLFVIPGSHRIMPVASGTNIPNWATPYEAYLRDHGRPVAVDAGSALIYNTKTLHFSPPNLSDRTRPAIAAAVVPSGEPLIHVVGDGMHTRRVYAVDRQFFVDYHPFAVENGMPEQYPLIEEYHEELVSAEPAAIAVVGEPGDIPVPTGDVEVPEPRPYPPTPEGEASGDQGAEDAEGPVKPPEEAACPEAPPEAPPAPLPRWRRMVGRARGRPVRGV